MASDIMPIVSKYDKNMTTITIPKALIKEKELVLIPRREYKKLLAGQAVRQEIKVRRSASFSIPKKHEKFYEKLDKELTECLREYKKGRYHGPFETIEEGKRFLESRVTSKK